MASTRFSCFSSTEKSFMLPIPGSMPRIFSSGPSFRIILNCARKSFRSKVAFRIFSSIRRASSSSMAAAAFSTSDDDIAHAEDAPRQPVRVKRLELVELFADARELDRAAA